MRLPAFVCLSVCLLARLLKNACMYLDEMLVYRIYRFKLRLGLFKRFIRLREYPILKPILG